MPGTDVAFEIEAGMVLLVKVTREDHALTGQWNSRTATRGTYGVGPKF